MNYQARFLLRGNLPSYLLQGKAVRGSQGALQKYLISQMSALWSLLQGNQTPFGAMLGLIVSYGGDH